MKKLLALLLVLLAAPAGAQVCDQAMTLGYAACPAWATDCTSKASSISASENDDNIENWIDICETFDSSSATVTVSGSWTFLSAVQFEVAGPCIWVDSNQLFHDTDCDETKDPGEEYLDGAGAAEVNDLEGTVPSSILDTEFFIGTGAGTGQFVSMGGDGSLANDGSLTVATARGLAPDAMDAMSDIDAGIIRGQDGVDTHLLTTAASAPLANRCLEMDSNGSVVIDSLACNAAGTPSFDVVTAGTNTDSLLVGTGGSLGVSGSGTIEATDVTCTDCLNQTEIEDLYALLAGDTMTGPLTLDDGVADSPYVGFNAVDAVCPRRYG
jgi:hypothetical protein